MHTECRVGRWRFQFHGINICYDGLARTFVHRLILIAHTCVCEHYCTIDRLLRDGTVGFSLHKYPPSPHLLCATVPVSLSESNQKTVSSLPQALGQAKVMMKRCLRQLEVV